jgi:hypothetical protein
MTNTFDYSAQTVLLFDCRGAGADFEHLKKIVLLMLLMLLMSCAVLCCAELPLAAAVAASLTKAPSSARQARHTAHC